jgi:hypothetical protein
MELAADVRRIFLARSLRAFAGAASVTAVPRSLASALAPLLSGRLFTLTLFGWPLVIAGALKAAYDLALLWRFAKVKPPEELKDAQRTA